MRTLWTTVVAVAALAVAAPAAAQYDPTPQDSPWNVPGQPKDEAGNSNTQIAEKVLQAVKLIKTGKKYVLGHVSEAGMPAFPGNSYEMKLKPPLQTQRQAFHFEHLATEIGQNGTQFDVFGHLGLIPDGEAGDILYYNRFTGTEVIGPFGLKHLGVEHIKPIFTRAILIDVKRYVNGGRTLTPGTEITLEMVRKALAAQGLTEDDIRVGDVVLFVTGWEEFWDDGTAVYYAGAAALPGATPGIGLEVAIWAGEKRVAVVGSDNWGVEAIPSPRPTPGLTFPVHNELLVRNGIPMQESMVLGPLADDLAAELRARPRSNPHIFAYVYTPVPIKGATGSPGVPIAIR